MLWPESRISFQLILFLEEEHFSWLFLQCSFSEGKILSIVDFVSVSLSMKSVFIFV